MCCAASPIAPLNGSAHQHPRTRLPLPPPPRCSESATCDGTLQTVHERRFPLNNHVNFFKWVLGGFVCLVCLHWLWWQAEVLGVVGPVRLPAPLPGSMQRLSRKQLRLGRCATKRSNQRGAASALLSSQPRLFQLRRGFGLSTGGGGGGGGGGKKGKGGSAGRSQAPPRGQGPRGASSKKKGRRR